METMDDIINPMNERHRLTAQDIQKLLTWAGLGQFVALIVRNQYGLQLVVSRDEPDLRQPLRDAIGTYAQRKTKET